MDHCGQFSVYCMQEVQFVTQFIHLCHYLFYITQQIFKKIEIPSQTDIFISIWWHFASVILSSDGHQLYLKIACTVITTVTSSYSCCSVCRGKRMHHVCFVLSTALILHPLIRF